MIGRVYRGHGTAGLIRYLYGPARAESPVAHHDPHLVASWLGHSPAVLAALEPVPLVAGDVAGAFEDGRLLAAVGGRGLSAGAARAAAQLVAASGQGSVWDPPDAPRGHVDGADGAGEEGSTRPVAVPGPVDARHLVRALEAPLREQQRAAKRGAPAPATEHVWHVALRNADPDRRLTDAEWAQVAADVVHRTGLSPRGPDGRPAEGGCPWVAVRHDDTSIHLVVVLAREDGKAVRLWRDYRQLRDACRAAEQTYGLTATAPADRTADTHTSRAEVEKATRLARKKTSHDDSDGRHTAGATTPPPRPSAAVGPGPQPPAGRLGEPARDQLRRHVQAAAAASSSEQEFFARLRAGGLLVRTRLSQHDPGEVTGYAVALPILRSSDVADPGREAAESDGAGSTASGVPVFFGGGKLAPDLTLPQLQRRWADQQAAQKAGQVALDGDVHISVLRPVAPADAWQQALVATEAACSTIELGFEGASLKQQREAAEAAWAASDLVTMTARLLEGPAGRGPLSSAAQAFGRAARPARTAPRAGADQPRTAVDGLGRHDQSQASRPADPGRVGSVGRGLRQAAAALGTVGRVDNDVLLMLRLVAQVADLIEAVQGLREAQRHAAQASAARTAATQLREAVRQYDPTGAARPAVAAPVVPRRPVAADVRQALREAASQRAVPGTVRPARRAGVPPVPAPSVRGRRR